MKNKKKLIDLLIDKYNYSEKESIGMIMSGKVLVNNIVITSPYYQIRDSDNIRIKEKKKYVSRGAYKLLTAFKNFNLNVTDKIAIDIGSSTGGFTQVLLEKGAKKVYAIDCGTNQLNYSLRVNPKVVVIENRVIQSIKINDFEEKPDFAVMDLSFTSSIPIIYYVFNNLLIKEMVVLIKPQFEFERYKEKLNLFSNFNGIVNSEDREKIIEALKKDIIEMNLKIVDIAQSDIKGTKGNIEYLLYIKKLNKFQLG